MTTTIETSSLDKALRTLKLSGMPGTIEARLAQARAGELGHTGFLQILCQDEITRREATSMTRRLHRARFEEQVTLEGFDFTAAPKLPATQIRDLAALRWLRAGESVILYGPVGVGKSHVAQAPGHLAVRHGAEARFLKTSRALAGGPQPRPRRIPARRAHQQSPSRHERAKLPAQKTTRPACHHDSQPARPVKQDQGQGLVNYLSNTPAQLRDR